MKSIDKYDISWKELNYIKIVNESPEVLKKIPESIGIEKVRKSREKYLKCKINLKLPKKQKCRKNHKELKKHLRKR